jgi:hypothetical protein
LVARRFFDMKRKLAAVAFGSVLTLIGGVAWADFTPDFTMTLSDTKVLGNPQLDFHLEFDAEDEEIGNFKATLPKGFDIAADEDIPDNEEIGGGDITIEAGPGCNPASPSDAIDTALPISATFYEKARTDEEIDQGVHAVWFLDLEPLNRVRLLVTGSKATGWTVEGAPTPSDWTCNPLVVDLTINAQSESGVAIVTNSKKPGSKVFTADISSQESPTVAHFEQVIKITK